jgi:hypothetical protein
MMTYFVSTAQVICGLEGMINKVADVACPEIYHILSQIIEAK